MRPTNRLRSVALRRVALLATSLLALGGLGSCVTQDESAPDRPGRAAVETQEPPKSDPRTTIEVTPGLLDDLPEQPTRDDAARLAEHIVLVEEVLGDPGARAQDVARAGEFEQLAARELALGPEAYAEDVLGRLPTAVQAKTRAHVEAAALLDSMAGAVPELPDWRIVEPPPAEVLLGHYRSAGRQIGVPWEYLAAVHLVETRMGRIRGVSTAGAQGPMQFIPTTWAMYGEGGDVDDPEDAILAAARLLRANGAPENMSEALWHYNPSNSYVGAVTRYAEQIETSPSAYAGYWHWRVIYKHVDGPVVLDIGYPEVRPEKLG